MFDPFVEWVRSILGAAAYEYAAGMWVETEAMKVRPICSIHQAGGPRPDVDDRRPSFRVILLGPRSTRAALVPLRTDIERLAAACLGDTLPCGAAQATATEPVGPGFTNEDRVWFSLEIQLLH